MAKVTVYTKHNCIKCDMTKKVLSEEGIEFEAINVEEDADAHEEMKKVADEHNFMSMPVIVADGVEPFNDFKPDKLKGLK